MANRLCKNIEVVWQAQCDHDHQLAAIIEKLIKLSIRFCTGKEMKLRFKSLLWLSQVFRQCLRRLTEGYLSDGSQA